MESSQPIFVKESSDIELVEQAQLLGVRETTASRQGLPTKLTFAGALFAVVAVACVFAAGQSSRTKQSLDFQPQGSKPNAAPKAATRTLNKNKEPAKISEDMEDQVDRDIKYAGPNSLWPQKGDLFEPKGDAPDGGFPAIIILHGRSG